MLNFGIPGINFSDFLPHQLLCTMPFALHDAEDFIEISVPSTPSSKLPYLLYPGLLITILLPAYRLVLKDYQSFLALGPGGTPKTFLGYLRVSYLRLFTISDPFQPPTLAGAVFPTNGYLRHLSPRLGCRPTVGGIAPHRQLNQKCTTELHRLLQDALEKLAEASPSLIQKGRSCFEKHGLALFLSPCTQSTPFGTAHPRSSHLNPTCKDTGEICHLHAVVSRLVHQSLVDVQLVMSFKDDHSVLRASHPRIANPLQSPSLVMP